MLTIETGRDTLIEAPLLRAMFEARKSVFVDLLKWDVPVIDGRFEIDQFDDAEAVYLIVTGPAGEHCASARLLRTERPHILDSLFPMLCEEAPPRGAHVLEITRFCLGRAQSAARRRGARDTLVAGLADYALAHGINRYTGVAEMGWFQQILAFGWECRPLGLPRRIDGRLLAALSIEITEATPALLCANGIQAGQPAALARAA